MSAVLSFSRFAFSTRVQCRARCRAFSLIETLVVLAIIAGVNLMAWPTLAMWSARLRVEWTVQALGAALAFARSEAANRGIPTTLCRSDSGQACSSATQSCHGRQVLGRDWRCGWIVVAGGRDDARDRNGGAERVLRRFPGVDGVSIVANVRGNAITFKPPVGQANSAASNLEVAPAWASPLAGRASLGREDGAPRRCLRVNMMGRARVEHGQCK
jgi:type IV fimbrial biogenesis protein FimT